MGYIHNTRSSAMARLQQLLVWLSLALTTKHQLVVGQSITGSGHESCTEPDETGARWCTPSQRYTDKV